MTYTAEYEESPREYTITWLDGDGNTLLEESVAYGDTPEYTGDEEPTKEADENYRYSFNGTWDPEIEAVTGEATYTAQFDEIPLYSVTVIDPDNSPTMEADVEKAAEGDTVTVTVTADGYTIDSVMAEYEDGEIEATAREDGKYTFTMPAADVMVRASLAAQTFIATAKDPEDAPDGADAYVTLLVDGELANASTTLQVQTDETVTVYVSWNNQESVLDSVTMTWDGESETQDLTGHSFAEDTSATTIEFKMPPGNAEFTATFSPVYEIYVEGIVTNWATVSVNDREYNPDMPSTSKAGETVYLDITPEGGGAIAAGVMPTVTVHDGNNVYEVNVSGDGGDYSFKMPTEFNSTAGYVSVSMNAYAVMVTGDSVDESSTYSITVSANGTELTITDADTGVKVLLVSPETLVEVRAVTTDSFIHDAYAESDVDVPLEGRFNEGLDDDHPTDMTYSFEMPEADVDITITFGGA